MCDGASSASSFAFDPSALLSGRNVSLPPPFFSLLTGGGGGVVRQSLADVSATHVYEQVKAAVCVARARACL